VCIYIIYLCEYERLGFSIKNRTLNTVLFRMSTLMLKSVQIWRVAREDFSLLEETLSLVYRIYFSLNFIFLNVKRTNCCCIAL
jgi:hypothetical protein